MAFETENPIEDEWETYQRVDRMPFDESPTVEMPNWALLREIYEGIITDELMEF